MFINYTSYTIILYKLSLTCKCFSDVRTLQKCRYSCSFNFYSFYSQKLNEKFNFSLHLKYFIDDTFFFLSPNIGYMSYFNLTISVHYFKSIPPSSGQYYYLFILMDIMPNPVYIIKPYSMGKNISRFSHRDRQRSNNYSLFICFSA